MAPVHSFNICDRYNNCDQSSHMVDLVKQDACNDNGSLMDVIKKLCAAKAAQGDNQSFFVMCMERLSGVLGNWYTKMPNVKPFYTMRCNSDPVLLKVLTENVDMGLCCSNRLELEMALNYVDKDRIIYANPLWTRANIRHAKECGIQTVVIESEDDLNRFATYFPEASIIVRVVMDPRVISGPIVMNNVYVDEAVELLRMAKDLTVQIGGVSLSVRSDTPSPTIYSYAIAQCRRLFDIGLEMGHKMDVLDLGDGFPKAAATGGLSFDQVAGSLRAAFSLFFPQKLFGDLKVIAEPGAYFAASPYSLVTRIIDKRLVNASLLTSDDSDVGSIGYIYQISDGFYGPFGCRLLTHCNPTCSPLMKFGEKLGTYAAVVGPESCDTDVILSLTILPPLQVGDWLIWHDMGAYTMNNGETMGRDGLPPLAIHHYMGEETKSSDLDLKAPLPLAGSTSDLSTLGSAADEVSSESELSSHADAIENVTEEFEESGNLISPDYGFKISGI